MNTRIIFNFNEAEFQGPLVRNAFLELTIKCWVPFSTVEVSKEDLESTKTLMLKSLGEFLVKDNKLEDLEIFMVKNKDEVVTK